VSAACLKSVRLSSSSSGVKHGTVQLCWGLLSARHFSTANPSQLVPPCRYSHFVLLRRDRFVASIQCATGLANARHGGSFRIEPTGPTAAKYATEPAETGRHVQRLHKSLRRGTLPFHVVLVLSLGCAVPGLLQLAYSWRVRQVHLSIAPKRWCHSTRLVVHVRAKGARIRL
jgi:hypothetical protein